ncbi:MAG: pyrroloquinoline quinone precursor peptide PqqA [Streptosporangiales bacterium]
MDREGFMSRSRRNEWETPAFEEIGVSAEASAYMGVWEFDLD